VTIAVPIITREQCGLRPPAGPVSTNITPGGPSGGSTAHYEGPALGGFPWPHSRCPSIWRADQAWHIDHNHWADIAYTGGICIHGFIFVGRWFGRRTAANGSNEGNQRSYAWCYMAGQGEPFTDEAKGAMSYAFSLAQDVGGAGPNIWPHKHWFNTACPGDPVEQWLNAGHPLNPARPEVVDTVPRTHLVLASPVVALLPTPLGKGYIEIAADGGVFCYGDAGFHGSLPQLQVVPAASIVDGATTPSGGGYWLAGEDGGVYSFGDAPFKGSMGGKPLNASIRGFTATKTGAGYWLVGSDGGIFSFGDAQFFGSPA
jgi:hypothetical protein